MACCNYECRKCGYHWSANGSTRCPRCGSDNLWKDFDEDGLEDAEPDHHDEGDYDDWEEPEEDEDD